MVGCMLVETNDMQILQGQYMVIWMLFYVGQRSAAVTCTRFEPFDIEIC